MNTPRDDSKKSNRKGGGDKAPQYGICRKSQNVTYQQLTHHFISLSVYVCVCVCAWGGKKTTQGGIRRKSED